MLFNRPAPASADLVFGADAQQDTATSVAVAGVFAPLSISARASLSTSASITGAFAPLTVAAAATYLSNTARPTVGQTQHPWRLAEPAPSGAKAALQSASAAPTGWASGWQPGAPAASPLSHPLPAVLATTATNLAAGFRQADRQRSSGAFASQSGDRTLRLAIHDAYDAAARLRNDTRFGHQDGNRAHRPRVKGPWQNARRLGQRHSSSFQPARPAPTGWAGAFQDAMRPPSGITIRLVVVVPPTPAPQGDPSLLFACPPSGADLVFGRVCIAQPGAPLNILPAKYYMAVHTLSAERLPDLAAVPIFDLSLASDVGSFGWTFSASGPASLFDQLAPSAGLPTQIRITLDGIAFVFVVDSISREEKFGQRGARIAGRSATALLARPYARETTRGNASNRTAQQLAEEALEFSGASLSWGLEDWLVPAGAWSHSGTPLAAVQAIVEAAGGYLQSHRSAAQLLARHPYPTLPGGIPGGPWNWGGNFAADVELAPDALITQSIERRDGPDINAVYASGTSQGVVALIKRGGTAGDKLAPMVTDPLITAPEAASQRGLSVLGAGGAKHLVSLSLPVLTGAGQPGVLDVGQLVQVNASPPWRGRVRSVSVSAKMPSARQTVGIERHLETV